MEGDEYMSKIPNEDDAKNAVETLVRYIEKNGGELREGLIDTPKRVIDSFEELYNGYSQDADALLDATFNAEGYDGIVLLKDIELSNKFAIICSILFSIPLIKYSFFPSFSYLTSISFLTLWILL